MDWTLIGQGLLIAVTGVPAYMAFKIYRNQKRDETAARVRGRIVSFANNCTALRELIDYSVVHEMVASVVYSELIARNIQSLWRTFPLDRIPENYKWPWPITVPIHSEIINEYERLLRSNQEICAEISVQFPSLARIFQSVFSMFYSILAQTKDFVRDERVFGKIFIDTMKEGYPISSFHDAIFYKLSDIINYTLQTEQKNLIDALMLLRLVNNAILRLSTKELIKQSEREMKMGLKDIDTTETIFEDFQEAEKALTGVLTQQEILKFRELYTKIEVRQEDK